MATPVRPPSVRETKPIRIRISIAAVMLGCSYEHVRRLIYDDTFTVVRPAGRGNGKPVYVLTAEVEAYAAGNLELLAELRASNAKRNRPLKAKSKA